MELVDEQHEKHQQDSKSLNVSVEAEVAATPAAFRAAEPDYSFSRDYSWLPSDFVYKRSCCCWIAVEILGVESIEVAAVAVI